MTGLEKCFFKTCFFFVTLRLHMKNTLSITSLLANILFFAFACFIPKITLNATHITGGELSYECLGSNNFKITLKIYRDCLNGQAGFDNPAKITVWSGVPSYLLVLELPYTGATSIPYIAADPNWVPEGYSCVEVAAYTITATLPASPTGFIFAYQRCCRTNNITNIINSGNTGSTYWEQVPVADLCNNSPSFNNYPPLVLCNNQPMSFDHFATDLDGDSLVYHLCASNEGGSPSNPEPYATSTPPFSNIAYMSPFSESYPMFSVPNLAIDSLTGIVTVTPWGMGNFMVGICCDEYRGGTLIGSHHSDFRYSVANCPYGIGIENTQSLSIQVYPNPASEFIQIKSDDAVNVVVFDLMGKAVYQSTTANQLQNISINEWAAGVYTYRVFTDKGTSTGKFIKQ